MHRVLVSDPLPPEGLAILERSPNIELDMRTGLSGQELYDALAECDGVIVRSGTKLKANDLAGQKRLKVIVRAGVGVDNIDVPAATRAGIVVMNTPGGNTLSTAEHTIALLFSLCRQIPEAHTRLKGGKWDRKAFVGTQLAGKTLGVVGLGRVGQAVAKRAVGLEMTVRGYDPFVTPEKARELGVELVPNLDDLYHQVDIVTIHVPLSDDTRGLVGAEEMARMRKGALLINCARGGIVDEAALYESLKSGHLAGAAIDVFAEEPTTESPLFELPNVVVTPHLGASTSEAQLQVALEAARLMVDFFQDGKVRFAVNMGAVDPTEMGELRQYLDLGRRLGLLQCQLAKGPIRRATIRFQGEIGRKNTRMVADAFAMGLLEQQLTEVNMVNARVLAEERGLVIEERVSREPVDFLSLIRTEVETEDELQVASGTTRGLQYNRLVRLGEYRLDSFLDGVMLIYYHHDKPGLIGHVGTICGRYDVNIAHMEVGRERPGGKAVGILNLDSEPPAAALDEIRGHEHILGVQVVTLPKPEDMHASFG